MIGSCRWSRIVSASFSIAAWPSAALRCACASNSAISCGAAVPSAIFLRMAAIAAHVGDAQRLVGQRVRGAGPPPVLGVDVGGSDRAVGPLDRPEPEHRPCVCGIGARPCERPRDAVPEVPLLQLAVASRVIEERALARRAAGREHHVPAVPQPRDPVVHVLHAGDIDAAHVVDRQRVQPLQHAVPAALLDERRRVRLVDRVREQQRHDVGQRLDARDARVVGAAREQRDLRAALFEQLLHRAQLQRGNVGGRLVVRRVRVDDHLEQLVANRCHGWWL